MYNAQQFSVLLLILS